METSNRFQPLQNQDDEPATSSAQAQQTRPTETPRKATAETSATRNKNIPPPSVIVGKDNGTLLAALAGGNYWVKNTANSMIVHTQNVPDYDATIRALNDANLHYHTYTTNGFTLHTVENIQEDINNNTPVEVIKAFKMRTKGAPLFVITNTNWNIA